MDEQERALRAYVNTLVLAALENGALHMAGILSALRRRSGDRFRFADTTVYPALHRMEHFGLITEGWVMVDSRARRGYELTAAGRERLAGDRYKWREFGTLIAAMLDL
jgi:PadR family transcriptional regulator